MISNAMNEFMKLVMKNKDVIDNVYFFDEIDVEPHYRLQAVEVRLKNYDVRMNYLDTEDNYHRIDPFKRDIKGYVYFIIGMDRGYRKWLQDKIEGQVASKLIRKYPQIMDGTLSNEKRKEMEKDRILFTEEIKNNL